MNALTDVHLRYYEIGTQLHIETIKSMNRSNTITMGEVVEEWLKGNSKTKEFRRPTWKMLVEVVANPNGGNNNYLAKKIAREHPGLYNLNQKVASCYIISLFAQSQP